RAYSPARQAGRGLFERALANRNPRPPPATQDSGNFRGSANPPSRSTQSIKVSGCGEAALEC
ncbi:MAG: hypothetical protein WD708_05775, partial [Kiritimatiellia bacterium]